MSKRKNIAIAMSLSEALSVAEQIHRQGGGDTVPKSALEPMVNSKTTSSAFTRKLSALRSYGLVSFQGEEVSLTSLGKAYATPVSSEAQKQVIIQAFRRIPVFENLISRYNGKPLPEINQFFYNLIAESYDIPHSEVKKWVNEFIEGAKLAGIIVSEAGQEFIRLPGMGSVPSQKPTDEGPLPMTDGTGQVRSEVEQEELVGLKILGGKVILNIPDDIDPKLLKKSIDAAKDALLMMQSRYKRLIGKDNDEE